MSGRAESLLVVKSSERLTVEQMELIRSLSSPLAEKMGMQLAICGEGMDIGIASDLAPALNRLLEEQRQTNQLLLLLIDALSEEGSDPDAEPKTYMDGTPVGYQPSTSLSEPPGDE